MRLRRGGGVLSGLVCGSLRLGNHFSTVRPILAGQLVFFFSSSLFPFQMLTMYSNQLIKARK